VNKEKGKYDSYLEELKEKIEQIEKENRMAGVLQKTYED